MWKQLSKMHTRWSEAKKQFIIDCLFDQFYGGSLDLIARSPQRNIVNDISLRQEVRDFHQVWGFIQTDKDDMDDIIRMIGEKLVTIRDDDIERIPKLIKALARLQENGILSKAVGLMDLSKIVVDLGLYGTGNILHLICAKRWGWIQSHSDVGANLIEIVCKKIDPNQTTSDGQTCLDIIMKKPAFGAAENCRIMFHRFRSEFTYDVHILTHLVNHGLAMTDAFVSVFANAREMLTVWHHDDRLARADNQKCSDESLVDDCDELAEAITQHSVYKVPDVKLSCTKEEVQEIMSKMSHKAYKKEGERTFNDPDDHDRVLDDFCEDLFPGKFATYSPFGCCGAILDRSQFFYVNSYKTCVTDAKQALETFFMNNGFSTQRAHHYIVYDQTKANIFWLPAAAEV